jgi:hypothetical protein
MGKYLAILDAIKTESSSDQSDKSDKRPPFGRFGRFGRSFSALEARCPDHVPVERWEQAVEDGKRFLAKWGTQAEALGWTSADLFGLAPVPEQPHPSYRRLSRYDCTGLIWLLQGRPVVALTEATAAIENPTGSIATYRRFNRPALGPVGDSLDDLK